MADGRRQGLSCCHWGLEQWEILLGWEKDLVGVMAVQHGESSNLSKILTIRSRFRPPQVAQGALLGSFRHQAEDHVLAVEQGAPWQALCGFTCPFDDEEACEILEMRGTRTRTRTERESKEEMRTTC